MCRPFSLSELQSALKLLKLEGHKFKIISLRNSLNTADKKALIGYADSTPPALTALQFPASGTRPQLLPY